MTGGCDLIRVSLGAYALGALDREERAGIDTHLTACPRCRHELSELGEVVDVLSAVPAGQVDVLDGLATSPEEEQPRVQTESRRRSRVRLALSVAAAVLALATAVTGASLLITSGAPAPNSVTVSAVDHATRVSTRLELAPRRWGTATTLEVRGVRPHQRCRLIVVGRGGTRETAATWLANYEGEANITGATAITLPAIVSAEVVGERGALLARMRIVRSDRRA
jgi:anti-sigma factor ChrR (cupin superfamily)